MKFIDVGKLLDGLNERKIPYDVEINEIILSQKVYEIEKVVEQLDNASKADRYDGMGGYVGKRTVYLDDAIEIVKQGCVGTDDVCEWKYPKEIMDNTEFEVSCNSNPLKKGVVPNNFSFCDFRYCPYCGKKIKVVD